MKPLMEKYRDVIDGKTAKQLLMKKLSA